MSVKKSVRKYLATLGLSAVLIVFAGCGSEKSISVDATWEISETTHLTNLTIEKNAGITTPDGLCVTMTVNHVETEIEPGTYNGDIVLTVTNEIQNPIVMGGGGPGGDGGGQPGGEGSAPEGEGGGAPEGAGGGASDGIRTAIYIDGGVYVPEKSVPAAVAEGTVTDNSAEDIDIRSTGTNFNGIIVTGDSTYSITNLNVNFNGGDQGNNGAVITSGGNADVTVNNASIYSKGIQRAAIVNGGNSTIHVNDSYIEVHDGTLLEKFAEMENSNSMEVPWVLGFIGNNRATNVVQNATAYYTNTHVKAQRWGCLSTDMAQSVKLYATNCHLEAVESGYGGYSIGDTSLTLFDGCKFDAKDYGLIMAGGSGTLTNGTVVNSGRFGVMVHSSNTGKLTIDNGCVFNTEKAVIQIKSAYPEIVVDNAALNSKNGVILEAIVNDDPWLEASFARSSKPINATFRNTKLNGDIVDALTSLADINIAFENVTITGAITTATSESQAGIDGVAIRKKTYYYIGAVKNTYCETDNKYGMNVSLDGSSTWIVDETSYVTSLILAEGAGIKAPEGSRVVLMVDGVETPIAAGTYKGKITLTVAEGA